MNEYADEAERRQHVIRVMGLNVGGMGCCPGCHQFREIFYRRRAIAPTKERCLDCWKGERERSSKHRSIASQ